MSLNQDPRQIAMLQEMGVRVWQPLAAPALSSRAVPVTESKPSPGIEKTINALPVAIDNVASGSNKEGALGAFDSKIASAPESAGAASRVMPAVSKPTAPSLPPASVAPQAVAGVEQMFWGIGQAQLLYPPSGADSEPARHGARWLVLAEVPGEALQAAMLQPELGFNAFAGDAGRLLDNMLRAARLHQALSVHLVPLSRNLRPPSTVTTAAGSEDEPAASVFLSSDLASAVLPLAAAIAPDLVLVMGRFAAPALLAPDQPFGKLRGQVQSLAGKPVVVMLDAGYLLRNQAYKAKAWDDLRLAMRLAAGGAAAQ